MYGKTEPFNQTPRALRNRGKLRTSGLVLKYQKIQISFKRVSFYVPTACECKKFKIFLKQQAGFECPHQF